MILKTKGLENLILKIKDLAEGTGVFRDRRPQSGKGKFGIGVIYDGLKFVPSKNRFLDSPQAKALVWVLPSARKTSQFLFSGCCSSLKTKDFQETAFAVSHTKQKSFWKS